MYHEDRFPLSGSALHHHQPSFALGLLRYLHGPRQQLGPAEELPPQRLLVDLLLRHVGQNLDIDLLLRHGEEFTVYGTCGPTYRGSLK